MPPKAKFTKEEIIEAALRLIRRDGMDALSARNLGRELGASSCPIFTVFSGMEEVQAAVLEVIGALYRDYTVQVVESKRYPPYKASGMAYIEFARTEPHLFSLLFMRNRCHEKIEDGREELKPILQIICANLGISEDKAYLFHLEMWIYVHGIATMITTSYLDWDMDFVSATLTDVYQGLCARFGKENTNGSH